MSDTVVEDWARAYVESTSLAHKLAPPPPPTRWASAPVAVRIASPGRPVELVAAPKKRKTPGAEALRDPRRRAELLHVFAHHELQAAEIFLWAILAFPETPIAFRRGLLHIVRDELRHLTLYRDHLVRLGHDYGSFPVRDWFWERVPGSVRSAAQLAAMMGVGFEGANLDHTRRFATAFRAAGDEEGARLQELVGEEEIPHVRFALTWMRELSGSEPDFARWEEALPPPITPLVMRGRPLDRAARARAGMDDAWLDALEAWEPRT